MKIGTKSLLFGAHQFILHPFFVFLSWWRQFGFPFNPRIWVAIIVHDWGYWGAEDIDGLEGKVHPVVGAKITRFLFGRDWLEFTLQHSRYFSKGRINKLCAADKGSLCFDHWLIYIPRILLSGEVYEFIKKEDTDTYFCVIMKAYRFWKMVKSAWIENKNLIKINEDFIL